MHSDATLLSDHDLHLFNEGTHLRLYEKLGSHPGVVEGVAETQVPTLLAGDLDLVLVRFPSTPPDWDCQTVLP